jgi:hypothetical protein
MRNLEKNIFGVIQRIFGARTVDPTVNNVSKTAGILVMKGPYGTRTKDHF